MLTVEKIKEMSYHGHNVLNHYQAQYHYLADQECYDLLCQTQVVGTGAKKSLRCRDCSCLQNGKDCRNQTRTKTKKKGGVKHD